MKGFGDDRKTYVETIKANASKCSNGATDWWKF